MIPLVLSHAQPEAGGIVLPSAAINTPGVEIHQLDSGADQKIRAFKLERIPAVRGESSSMQHSCAMRIVSLGTSISPTMGSAKSLFDILLESSKLTKAAKVQVDRVVREIESAGIHNLSKPSCGWSDGGSLIVEWALERRRVGFIFSDDIDDNGWFYVDQREGKVTSQNGQIGARNAGSILRDALE